MGAGCSVFFPETGSGTGQATLNSLARFIVLEVDGVGSRPAPALNTRTLLVSGHGADAGSTDTSRCLRRTLQESEVIC